MEPWDSGCKAGKCQHYTSIDVLFAISEAVTKVAELENNVPALALGILITPECLSKAISVVEDEEGNMGIESVMQSAALFQQDGKASIAYLAFKKRGNEECLASLLAGPEYTKYSYA